MRVLKSIEKKEEEKKEMRGLKNILDHYNETIIYNNGVSFYRVCLVTST